MLHRRHRTLREHVEQQKSDEPDGGDEKPEAHRVRAGFGGGGAVVVVVVEDGLAVVAAIQKLVRSDR